MNSYTEETYGERIAGVYDEWFPDHDAAAQRVRRQESAVGADQLTVREVSAPWNVPAA